MLAINDSFLTIEEARDAINRHVLDEGESYKVYKSTSQTVVTTLLFAKMLRANSEFELLCSRRKRRCYYYSFTYSYSPANHYNKQSSAIWFLKDHHRASLINNRALTPAQI